MSQNPYEAPQTSTIPTAVPATGEVVDVGPEILTVMRGAKLCYMAILIMASSLVAVALLGMFLPPNIVPLLGLGLLAALGVAAILHLLGMLKLLRIDPASRARGWLLASLIACGIVVACYATVIVLTYQKVQLDYPLALLAVDVLAMLATLTLMWGLLQIGNYLKQPEISQNAKIALIFFGLLNGAQVLVGALLFLPAFKFRVADWQRMGTGMSSVKPIYFSLLMIATIFYVKALDAIVKLRSKFDPNSGAALPTPTARESGLPPGQEMKF